MILSKLLFSDGVSSFAASITASRSSLSQILMPSIITARGIVPFYTDSKNLVLPIPIYAAASSARKPRGFIKWFCLCDALGILVPENKRTSAKAAPALFVM
jgi:hypothetical protein